MCSVFHMRSTCSPKYPSFSLNQLLPKSDPQMFLNLPSPLSWEWALLLSFIGSVILCSSCVFFLGLTLCFVHIHLLKKRMHGDKFWNLLCLKTFIFSSHTFPKNTFVFRTFQIYRKIKKTVQRVTIYPISPVIDTSHQCVGFVTANDLILTFTLHSDFLHSYLMSFLCSKIPLRT